MGPVLSPAESIARTQPSLTRLAWRRFRRKRTAVVSLLVLTSVVAGALLTLPVSLNRYNVQELTVAVRHPPSWSPVVADRGSTVGVSASPGVTKEATLGAADRIASWLGHDDLGRSLLYRLIPGLLVSMGLGLCAAAVSVVLGTLWGAGAALLGGVWDTVLMRVVDVLYGLPYLVTVILLKVSLTEPLTRVFGTHRSLADVTVLMLALGGVSWLTMSRIIRGEVLRLKESTFVDAARVVGAGPLRVFFVHIAPGLLGPITVYGSLIIPQAVLQEAFLSFLGIGIQQPTPSLGRLAADGVDAVNSFVSFWWLLVFPCGALAGVLVLLNLVTEGIKDAFDPRRRVARDEVS